METPGILAPDHAAHLVKDVGKKYRPSNGTEGDFFICVFCDRCKKSAGDNCPILWATLINDVEDPGYPSEWQYGEDGQPLCTQFVLEQPSHE